MALKDKSARTSNIQLTHSHALLQIYTSLMECTLEENHYRIMNIANGQGVWAKKKKFMVNMLPTDWNLSRGLLFMHVEQGLMYVDWIFACKENRIIISGCITH